MKKDKVGLIDRIRHIWRVPETANKIGDTIDTLEDNLRDEIKDAVDKVDQRVDDIVDDLDREYVKESEFAKQVDEVIDDSDLAKDVEKQGRMIVSLEGQVEDGAGLDAALAARIRKLEAALDEWDEAWRND